MLFLICYDIVSARRRRKVAGALLDQGPRVQKSAFECNVKSAAKLRVLVERLCGLIDIQTDTIRVYRICGACATELTLLGIDRAPPPRGKTIIV